MTTPYLTSNPAFAKRIAPYTQHIIDTANAHGVPPDLVLMTIFEESSGRPDAVGDNGQALGLFQVQRPFIKDYGFSDANDLFDPFKATTKIMPKLKRLLGESEGDWGRFTVGYKSGGVALRKINKGVSVYDAVLDTIGRKRYNTAKATQEKYGVSNVIANVSDAYLNKLAPVTTPVAKPPVQVVTPVVATPLVTTPTTAPAVYAAPLVTAPVVAKADTTVADYIKKQQALDTETLVKLARAKRVGTNPNIDFIDDLSTIDYTE